MKPQYDDDEIEIDLKEIFYLLKSKILMIAGTGIAFAVVAAVISLFLLTPMYEATAKLYILTKSTSITSLADIQLGSQLATDYVELVKSRPVAEKVIADLKLDTTYEDLINQMTVSNPSDTRILNITITDSDPQLAMEISNDYAKVVTKQISDILKTDEPTTFEEAIVPEKPVSPNKKKNVALGLLLGLFLAAAIIVVRYLLDDTLKTQEDIEKYLGLNTLAMIPMREDEVVAKKGLFHTGKKGR